MSATTGGWVAALVTGALLTASCGTPSTYGEQLPPVAIRSPQHDTEPEPEPDDDEVFGDRRVSTWENETLVVVASDADPAPPDEAGSDVLVVPATTIPPPPTTLPEIVDVWSPTVLAQPTGAPGNGPTAPPVPGGGSGTGGGTGTAGDSPSAGGTSSGGAGTVPAWPQYTTRPGLTDVAALTGWPVPAEVTAGPIIAVKIDNVGSARPQWHLDRADVVFEENVEGATRFLALYHSDVPDEFGPVRSARTTDIDLMPALNRPVLAWSGGNPGVTAWVDSAASSGLLVDAAPRRSPCYRRDPGRRAPHDLVASASCLLDRGASGGAGAAVPLWSIDGAWTPGALATTADASFEVTMDGGSRAGWSWDPASAVYVRSQNGSPHVTAAGAAIAAENVVVMTVPHRPSVIDARSPHAETIGIGPAVIHRDGMAIAGSWVRATMYDPFQFVAADGSQIPLQIGRTFVELAR